MRIKAIAALALTLLVGCSKSPNQRFNVYCSIGATQTYAVSGVWWAGTSKGGGTYCRHV